MVYVYICKNPNEKIREFHDLSSGMVFNSRDYSIFDHIKETREKIRLYQFCKSKDEMSDLFIFTDSDFVVRELNNLITLGEIARDKIKEESILREYDNFTYLKQDEVKAYSIDGSEIRVDHMGMYAKDFDKLIDNQNNLQGDIIGEFVRIREEEVK